MKNRTLELLYLDSARPEDEEAFNRIQAELQGSTLLPRAKVAFLHVIQSQQQASETATQSSSSLKKFDASIVSQIFAFAGLQRQRRLVW